MRTRIFSISRSVTHCEPIFITYTIEDISLVKMLKILHVKLDL